MMKTAKEIFDQYFGKDITLNSQHDFERLVILPAMEAFAHQSFDAARRINPATGNYAIESFDGYQLGLLNDAPVDKQDSKILNLQSIADSILPQYIPSNPADKNLSFSFTLPI